MPKRGARASLDKAPAAPSPAKKACVTALTADELIARAAREPTRATFDYRCASSARAALRVRAAAAASCMRAQRAAPVPMAARASAAPAVREMQQA
jgi:hypothetical protein